MRTRLVLAASVLLLAACGQGSNAQPPNAAGAAQAQAEQEAEAGLAQEGEVPDTWQSIPVLTADECSTPEGWAMDPALCQELLPDTTNSVNDPSGTARYWPQGVWTTITDVAIGPLLAGYTESGKPDPSKVDPDEVEVRVTVAYSNDTQQAIEFGQDSPAEITPWEGLDYGPNGQPATVMLGGSLWEDEWLDTTWQASAERIAAGSEVAIGYRYAVPTAEMGHLEFSLRMNPSVGPEHRWLDVQDIARTVTP